MQYVHDDRLQQMYDNHGYHLYRQKAKLQLQEIQDGQLLQMYVNHGHHLHYDNATLQVHKFHDDRLLQMYENRGHRLYMHHQLIDLFAIQHHGHEHCENRHQKGQHVVCHDRHEE